MKDKDDGEEGGNLVTARTNERLKTGTALLGKMTSERGERVLEQAARVDDSGYEHTKDDAVVADGCVSGGFASANAVIVGDLASER